MSDSGLTECANGFYRWFDTFLKDRGLQFSRCGFKLGDGLGRGHDIDPESGYWQRPSYSRNKPPRWLYKVNIDRDGGLLAQSPVDGPTNVGQANTSQGDKAGIAVRVLPLIQPEDGATFHRDDRLEAQVLFVFRGPVPRGSSSESFVFDPDTGEMKYKDDALSYEAALLSVRPRTESIEISTGPNGNGTAHVAYGDVIDALTRAIKVKAENDGTHPICVVDLSNESAANHFKNLIEDRWQAWVEEAYASGDEQDGDEMSDETDSVPPSPDLVGVDASVYRDLSPNDGDERW